MNRLIIIDGHAILHRAYHALPPLTNSKGELVNAVFGFTSMLIRVINDLKPTHMVVCFDLPTPTFRNALFKEYQSQRPKMDKELSDQINLVHKVVTEMGIKIYEMDGYEADDLIGTLATKANESRVLPHRQAGKNQESGTSEVIIVTGDRDMLQLVDEHTKIYMPVKGLSESKMYGEHEVEEKYGIKPEKVVDYKALVGDPSDNYPGIPGIGPKSAVKLINEYGSLDGIYSNIDLIKNEKLKKLIIDNKESAEISKKLAGILKSAPIEVDFEKLKLGNLLKPNIVALFEELGFRSLIPRLGGNNKEKKTEKKEQKTKNMEQKTDNNKQISIF
jgi:DNA polymerase I